MCFTKECYLTKIICPYFGILVPKFYPPTNKTRCFTLYWGRGRCVKYEKRYGGANYTKITKCYPKTNILRAFTGNTPLREGPLTPHEFYRRFVDVDLDRYVCLINSPKEEKPYHKRYTVKYLGNIVGGQPVTYLNVPIETMIDAAKQMLTDNHPVWFGADAGKAKNRDLGVFDTEIYDHDTLYGTKLQLDKAERLDYDHSRMTHAMVFTGVNIEPDGHPMKWRVENSGGPKLGDKGFYTMTTP